MPGWHKQSTAITHEKTLIYGYIFNRSAPFATLDSVLAFSELASAIKSDGREWSEKSCQKMVERELKRTPPSEYSVGEKVIIRASWPQTTRETAD